MKFISSIVLIASLSAVAAAQNDKIPRGDALADEYLQRTAKEFDRRFLAGAQNREDWEAARPKLREQYFEMLGLWPIPEKSPLQATVTRTLERDDFDIELLHYQSKPGLYVTANLYRPKDTTKKHPAILYVCGHSGRGRDGNKTAFQDHGAWFARNGYVCLIVDTLQLGELPGKHHGTYNLERFWWQSRGYTPAGVECWNGIRGIDYLVSRPDVDAERIGVTGISGGGATTLWVAAADERVKVAIPVSGMSDLESYVGNKVINGHCDCMLMINTYFWEWTTIAALVAPRPMLFANSDNDPIFPMDGNRRIIERLRTAYAMYGQKELLEEYVSQGGHDYRPDLRVAVFSFMNKHLKGDSNPVKDVEYSPLPGEMLRVFAQDHLLPKDSLNDTIDETFVPQANVQLPTAGEFAKWKQQMLTELRRRSFRGFPERLQPARMVNAIGDEEFGWRMVTERGVPIRVQWEEGDPNRPNTWIVLGDDDPTYGVPKWAEPMFKGECFMCSPRGHGLTAWTRKNPPNYVERSYPLLGRSVDQMRVWDTIASFREFHAQAKERRWNAAGKGKAGILAAYAALLEPDFAGVILVDPPTSHRDGPHFLNVLRVLDIPDALGLLAPRPLTIHSNEKAFERTAAIYKLAGAEQNFRQIPVKN